MKKYLMFIIPWIWLCAVSAWAFPPVMPGGGGGTHLPSCANGQVAVYNTGTGLWDTCADNDGGATLATDTLWDAAGDLVQGTGANTAAKLTKGAQGTILRAGAASNAYSTSTFADTYAKGTILYNASANTVAGLAHPGAANYILATNAADTAAWLLATNLSAINALTFADASIIQLTGAGTVAVLTSGGNNYVLGSNADNSALEFKTPANVLSQIGAQAAGSYQADIGLTAKSDSTSTTSSTTAASSTAVKAAWDLANGKAPAFVSGSANYFWATPNGSAGVPSLRAIDASDLPVTAANGATLGIAGFKAADFDAYLGIISIDYANGQAAGTGVKGFLTGTDWDTFNGKQAALTYPITGVASPSAGYLMKWGASGNTAVDGLKLGTMTDTKYCTYSTANGLVCNSTISGGGDLLANGSVPLTANWNVGAFTITAAGFTAAKSSGTAGLQTLYDDYGTELYGDGWMGSHQTGALGATRYYQFPTAANSAGQVIAFGTPGGGISVGTWITPLTTGANTFTGDQTISGHNLITDTSTGSKIGTATNQKLGFFNSNPIVQPTGAVKTALSNLGLVASPTIDADTLGGATFASPGAIGGTTSAAGTFTSLTVSDATNDNYIAVTNNSVRAATPSAYEIYPAAGVWQLNTNGTAAAILYSGGALGTPSGGTLTNASGLPIAGLVASTSTALGVGSIELGHASDTSITRVSAGVAAIEGANIHTDAAPAAIDGHTDATAITAAQMSDPRCNVYNTGQGAGNVTLTLPAAAASLSCLFTVGTTVASNKWRVRAASGDKIYNLAADGTPTAGSDNGYVGYSTTAKYPVIGNSFACYSFKTDNYDWICKPFGNIVLTAE